MRTTVDTIHLLHGKKQILGCFCFKPRCGIMQPYCVCQRAKTFVAGYCVDMLQFRCRCNLDMDMQLNKEIF